MGYTKDECKGCGKIIEVINKIYNRNKKLDQNNYCCKKCFNNYRKNNSVINVQCSICGKNLERYKKSASRANKYFCKECRGMITASCSICGKKIIRSKHDTRKYKRLFCSEKCRATGSLKDWTETSRCMLKDHWVRVFGIKNLFCRRCGYKKSYNIVLHHIKYVCNGGTNDPINLEPLCKNCHGEEHYDKGIDVGEADQPLKMATQPELIREIK